MLNLANMHSHSITDLQNAVKPLGEVEYPNVHTYCLEPLTVPSVGPNGEKYPNKQEGINPMYMNATANTFEDNRDTKQRRYLRNEASSAFYNLKSDLKRKFFLVIDGPKDMNDMIQRIKDGKFTFDAEKYGKTRFWGDFNGLVDWRTEDQKEDQDGYKAARARLDAAYAELQQDIEIRDPETALRYLRTFAKTDFSKEDTSSES